MTALTLRQGDAVELLNALSDGSVDCVMVDPPYGKTKLPWDRPLPWASLWPELHRLAKPVELLRWLVRTYTRPGEVILDCCMGSGSTGVAALVEGRRFIGMEKDAGIFAQAQARLAEWL